MEQCGAAVEEAVITVAVGHVAVSGVTEKHEIEVQEKTTISCHDMSQVQSEDCTELSVKSPKEDGELSSARCLLKCLLDYVVILGIFLTFFC